MFKVIILENRYCVAFNLNVRMFLLNSEVFSVQVVYVMKVTKVFLFVCRLLVLKSSVVGSLHHDDKVMLPYNL